MTLETAYRKIDGMNFKLNGVSGKLTVEVILGMTEIIHSASAAGRRTKQYRKTRSELLDHYTTTVTSDDATMQAIFAKVGC
jgi:hypothetical protein